MLLEAVLLCASILIVASVALRYRRQQKTCAFFHPYCNAGGGGERVLWCAINAMQKRFAKENYKYVVYTGDTDANPREIVEKAQKRFNVVVDASSVHFVYLHWRGLLEAERYPRFTLLCQTLAGFVVGLEALWRLNPAIFVDSMGYPLTLPLFRWFAGASVACYVHYPTISTDMIGVVQERRGTFNNAQWIAQSTVLSRGKLLYYRLFALLYKLCGKAADVIMVNSTWTFGHIAELWARPGDTNIVYPPCDVDTFCKLNLRAEQLRPVVKILSIGQIRPEKNHRLQLESFALLKKELASRKSDIIPRLVVAGGCRHKDDIERAESLQKYAKELNIDDSVEWRLNIPFDELLVELSEAMIGVHTMWNEHFGISVVEGMAAGNIMIASD
uniref:GDP-Man:Man(3)GlcNAc(2)-PP-Dol alpha-1,2-mannosyltransferase n=1 Tax=Plectus sambesii TaxID=2011161 RepID=A0A914XBY7_9BILA